MEESKLTLDELTLLRAVVNAIGMGAYRHGDEDGVQIGERILYKLSLQQEELKGESKQ